MKKRKKERKNNMSHFSVNHTCATRLLSSNKKTGTTQTWAR